MAIHKFNATWKLSDGYPVTNGRKVFGTFICGGGSTMGYKLAGYEHLGGVEIDSHVASIYEENHHPKYLFNEDIRAFNRRDDLPEELFNLDILDGSPPCSTFSISGSREKAWNKQKKFREGQALQTLDDLVFVYCDTIIKLQPKVFLLENVKGLIQGNAKAYCKKITNKMEDAGYDVQLFLLNAASMGVPQTRERVFFIGRKKSLNLPRLILSFKEKPIPFGFIKIKNCQEPECFDFPESEKIRLPLVKYGEINLSNADRRLRNRTKNHPDNFFNQCIVYDHKVLGTITGQEKQFTWDEKRRISFKECIIAGTFPVDYNFKEMNPKYLIGMSVPPVMTAQIADQIHEQWFSKFDI